MLVLEVFIVINLQECLSKVITVILLIRLFLYCELCADDCLSSFLSDVFMSQCAVQASSCLAGPVAGLHSGISSEFPDIVSG